MAAARDPLRGRIVPAGQNFFPDFREVHDWSIRQVWKVTMLP
jgi:hypothetical protein